MKFVSRKFVTALLSLVVVVGTAAVVTYGQDDSTQNETGRSRVIHNDAGPIRILVHGAW